MQVHIEESDFASLRKEKKLHLPWHASRLDEKLFEPVVSNGFVF